VSLAAKQKSHRPGNAPALGLRAGSGAVPLYRRPTLERKEPMWPFRKSSRKPASSQRASRHDRRLRLEALEERCLPAVYNAATVAQFIADIHAANSHGGTNQILLTAPAGSTYVVSAVDNSTDGPTGLPVITANDKLTILGSGHTIERNTAEGTPAFRLIDVAKGASLALKDLTLENGLASGSTVLVEGGAIYNQGTLRLTNVVLQGNMVQSTAGLSDALGGAIAKPRSE
jgi:hypothetical protein